MPYPYNIGKLVNPQRNVTKKPVPSDPRLAAMKRRMAASKPKQPRGMF